MSIIIWGDDPKSQSNFDLRSRYLASVPSTHYYQANTS